MTTSTATCSCPRCVIDRAGVSGPFTPKEFAALGLDRRVVGPSHDDDGVANDPGVLAGQLAVTEARREWEILDEEWRVAEQARRTAEAMPSRSFVDKAGRFFTIPGRQARDVTALTETAKELREARDDFWKRRVVKANDRLREATLAAQVRVAEAERGGNV